MNRVLITLINCGKLPFFAVLYVAYLSAFVILQFLGIWLNIFWVSWFIRQELPTDTDWFQLQTPTEKTSAPEQKEYRTTLDLALTSDHHELVVQMTVHGNSVGWIKFDKDGSQRVLVALKRLSDQIVVRPPCKVINLFPERQDG